MGMAVASYGMKSGVSKKYCSFITAISSLNCLKIAIASLTEKALREMVSSDRVRITYYIIYTKSYNVNIIHTEKKLPFRRRAVHIDDYSALAFFSM